MNNTNKVKAILRHMITPEDSTHVQEIAKTLAEAGLLMPDLPEPDLDHRDPEHCTNYQELWEGPVPDVWREGLPGDLTVQALLDGSEVQMNEDWVPMEPFSPEEARSLAHALLAAADNAEEEA